MRRSIQCANTERCTLAILHFWPKFAGKVVDRNRFRNAVDDDMDAVPLMLGMASTVVNVLFVGCRIVVATSRVNIVGIKK